MAEGLDLGSLDGRRGEPVGGAGGVKVMQDSGRWKGVEAGKPVSGEEVVEMYKVKLKNNLRTRLASCFCSACQRSQYKGSHVNRAYPGILPAMRKGQVRETIILDTGVAPVPVKESEAKKEITLKPRTTTCEMARVTGTQWQESDSEAASKLWNELEREEEPTLIARFGKRAGC